MILAAGLGTRLRPLTDHLPKALVKVDGIPMLERVIMNLRKYGVDEVVVNIHHLGNMIVDFLSSKDYGVEIEISDESDCLLDTGGGLVKAKEKLFSKGNQSVLIHNVDILGNANLDELQKTHLTSGNDITLLINKRESSRVLLFDNNLNLKGWHNKKTGEYKPDGYYPKSSEIAYAFSGLYMINRRAVDEMEQLLGNGKFSVIDYFVAKNRMTKIGGYYQKNLKLLDIGKPTTLSQASDLLRGL